MKANLAHVIGFVLLITAFFTGLEAASIQGGDCLVNGTFGPCSAFYFALAGVIGFFGILAVIGGSVRRRTIYQPIES